jgi:hypothetical protein
LGRTLAQLLALPASREALGCSAYARLRDLLRQVFPDRAIALMALERPFTLNDARTPTLLHGDTDAGNMFFEADGRRGSSTGS